MDPTKRWDYYGRDPQNPSHALSLGPQRMYYQSKITHQELETLLLNMKRPAILQNPYRQIDVILVSVTEEESGVTYCDYVEKLGFGHRSDVSFEAIATDIGEKRRITFVQAQKETKWCLG